jgi:hypothetical protein
MQCSAPHFSSSLFSKSTFSLLELLSCTFTNSRLGCPGLQFCSLFPNPLHFLLLPLFPLDSVLTRGVLFLNRLASFRSDNATENVSGEIRTWFKSEGIRHELSAPYCQWQDSKAMRFIRTVWEGAEAMRNYSVVSSKALANEGPQRACRGPHKGLVDQTRASSDKGLFRKEPREGLVRATRASPERRRPRV